MNEILADDTLFREQLITILMASPNIDESVKKEQVEIEQKTVEFKKDEVKKLVNEFTVDVFYLEDILRESEPGAKRVMTTLQSAYPDQRIRLRRLQRRSPPSRS